MNEIEVVIQQPIIEVKFESNLNTGGGGSGTVESVNNVLPDGNGNVEITTSNINEGTNLYFTDARAIAALATTLLNYVTTSQLADKQDKRIVVSSNTTAVNDGAYTLLANATFTDPSPVAGKGFSVLIRNGTATIGGTNYSTAGTTVWRVFHSGSWANYVNQLGLGFTPENVANKATTFGTVNDTLYPSVEAVSEQLALKEDKRIVSSSHTIDFTVPKQFGTILSPLTTDLLVDYTGAVNGLVQVIYYTGAITYPLSWTFENPLEYNSANVNMLAVVSLGNSKARFKVIQNNV